MSNEPAPTSAGEETRFTAESIDPFVAPHRPAVDATGLVVSCTLAIISLLAPPAVAMPLLFLSLGTFGWWVMQRAASGNFTPSVRIRSYAGLIPSLLFFVTGLVAGPLALWCYAFGVAWYWLWLALRCSVRRGQGKP